MRNSAVVNTCSRWKLAVGRTLTFRQTAAGWLNGKEHVRLEFMLLQASRVYQAKSVVQIETYRKRIQLFVNARKRL